MQREAPAPPSPLALKPAVSQRRALEHLAECSQVDLLEQLKELKVQRWERCVASSWHPVLNRFDNILAAFADPSQRAADGAPDEELVCEVLRVLHDIVFLHQELKGAVDRLRDLLQCSELKVLLGALRCLAACPPSRYLQSSPLAAAMERRLEVLACCGAPSVLGSTGFRDACSSEDSELADFEFEIPESAGTNPSEPSVLKVPAASAAEPFEVLLKRLEESPAVTDAIRPALMLQLRLWCRARTLEGRQEVVAIALLAMCNSIKHVGPCMLQQYLQKRPGLLSELCELLQSLQAVGSDTGVAALRVTGAILDSRFGQSRSEASQLSQMLGLSLPHGIVACALRGLLGHQPTDDQLEGHNRVLLAALDLFQVTTVSNHQTTAQLGHAGMILAMLELMQKTDVACLPAVTAMLRCLELAAEVSGTAALVLFRDFSGLQAFSLRLQREVELMMALDFTGDAFELEPPGREATREEKQRYWQLLEEVTARRKLCRQLLKNIQTALQCTEVLQAGLANVFQGPLMDALKTALKEPSKVGLSLFGTAIDIVSSIIQDDPARVPQMIDSEVLPGIMAALSKDTMRSAECVSFVPGVLASIALHSVGEDFLLNSPSKPIQLLTDILVDPSFAPLLHSQPEIAQIMSTQVDKVLRNRPAGPNKLTDHVVDCMLAGMRSILDQAKDYPEWTPLDLEDHTEYLADRLVCFSRFCWSILSTNEQTLKSFLEKKGLALVRELHELPCLPYHLTSLEGQQHPMAGLFNLQARGPDGNLAVAAELEDMLNSNFQKAEPMLNQCVPGSDPYTALAAADDAQVSAFLRSISRSAAALEGLLSVCREGSSVQVLEAVRAPLKHVGKLGGFIFALAAWYPPEVQERERNSATTSYHETIKTLFTPSSTSKSEGASSSGSSEAQPEEKKEREFPMKDKPLLQAARQSFRLTAHATRQLLVVVSKQLHSRARQREVTPTISGLATELAEVAKACVSAIPPGDTVANLQWTSDIFDLLLRMHEEQNRVAVRPLSLSAFYQVGGFELLEPLLQKVGQHLDLDAGPPALGSALAYLEKVTSHKRFTNAPQVGLLKVEDGFIPKDPLCRSVQAEALRIMLPVWRNADLARFPANAAQSLMKVWVHSLDGPRDIPPRPAQTNPTATANSGTTGGTAPTATNASTARGRWADEATRQSMVTSLMDMGFPREQVERRLQEVDSNTRPDIASLIMLMASGEETTSANPPAQEAAETPAPPPNAPPGVKAKTAAEFQELVADMLKDLLPRILLFGRKVPKAIPVVADAMAFIVAVPTQLWDQAVGKNGPEANASSVVQACLEALGESDDQPPADALACVAQVLASLLHRRQQVVAAIGPAGAESLLVKLNRWSLQSIDSNVEPFARGYRTFCMGSAAPAPEGGLGGGEALLAPPAWLTPVTVCAHQLLISVDLVQLRQGRESLRAEVQKSWVAGVLDILYAFPGLEPGLALACIQLLLRLCSTQIGAHAFLEYQPKLSLDEGKSLKAPSETAGGMILLLRLARKTIFAGMLQMIADLAVTLMEEGSALQARMENEILALFSPQVKTLPIKQIASRLNHLFIRNPDVFGEAIKAVTQKAQASDQNSIVLEPLPEAERSKQKPAPHSGALLMLQTLVSEICFNLELQHSTAFPKIFDASKRPEPEAGSDKKDKAQKEKTEKTEKTEKKEETEKESKDAVVNSKLPPLFPLALDSNALLFVLDALVTRVPGISALAMKPPLAVGTNPSTLPEPCLAVPDRSERLSQKSLLLVMTRHLLPRFAQLADVWQQQIQPLTHSQKLHLTHTGAIIPMQKCMPHLATTLASTARLSVEPRRALASEVVLSTKALADSESFSPARLSFGTEVAAVCGLVARLLGAAAAVDRKEDKEEEKEESRPGTSDAKGDSQGQKKAKGKKESSVFCNQSETQALRESLVAILLRTDLQCTAVMAVATGIVKCLEFLTRRETKNRSSQGPFSPEPAPPMLLEGEDGLGPGQDFTADFGVGDGPAHDDLDRDDEEDDEEEEDDDDLAEEDDEEAMAGMEGGHLPEHEDFGDEDYDGEFDDDYGDDDIITDDLLHGDDGAEPNLATILNNAIHVIDQQVQGFNPDQMGMQMNFSPDLGDAPPRRAPPRVGRGGMDFLGVTVGTGWSEPGDLDLPGEHPMLRREHQSHAQPLQQLPQLTGFQMPGASGVVDMSRMVQLVPGPDAFRQIFAGSGPTGGAAGVIGGPGGAQIVITSSSNLLPSAAMGGGGAAMPATTSRGGGALAAAAAESLDMAYGELAGRLSDELRNAPTESKDAPATETPQESQAPAPADPPAAPAEGETVAETEATQTVVQVPSDVVDEASELLARLNAEEAEEQVEEAPAEVPAEAEEPPDVEAEEASEAAAPPAAEDPAAALGIAELERLATSLGCTQTALLQAAEIDASVVAELPEDMRGAVVMATLSQVNVDHLRTRGATTEGAGTGPAPEAGYDEIDASVLEALPPEIREEVMREEERRRREQERAQQRATEAAATQAQAPQAPAAANVMSGDMDNASFIASLDPMLREEVLMTAPEEVLQTLPAELVAEAQMIRDRAFMRIASHREGPPPTQPPPQVRAPRPQPSTTPPGRPHQYLQAMEQQLSQLAGGRRAWLHGTDGRLRQASDDFMAQLGLALGGSRSRQAAPLVAATGAGVGTPGLSSFDEADRALLERLADYDEESCQGLEPPLPPSALPKVCQLLYLRHEVTVTPLTRLFFNLSLHPATRQFTLGQFLVLLVKEPQAVGCSETSLPPAHLYEGLENGPISNATEVKAVGAQRVLQILAYLLRRIPQCGEFFAKPLQKEPWLEGEAALVTGGQLSSLIGHHSVNVLLRLLTTKLFLASSRHAAWLLAILHSLLVPVKGKKDDKSAEASGGQDEATPKVPGEEEEDKDGKTKKDPPAEQQSLERWTVINKNMHAVLSQESVLALCHFLCQAGSGHGSTGEADTFQMAGEILVALAASQEHLTMVRADLMRVLADLVTNIEADLAKCEPGSTDPSTMETRLLRLVRTLAEVFKEAAKASADQELKIEDFLGEARLEDLWTSLDQTLDRLHDTEVFATPAQRILSTGVAPSQLRVESSTGSSMSGTLASNVQTTPPKPLLNRLLPLIEAFFVLHNGSKEAALEAKEKDQKKSHEQQGGSSSSCPGKQVFADLIEVTLVERSRFGQFCKQHRRPLNALIKQTPSLLSKSFSPVLKHMPHCLDFDNKRAYFRSQLRSRRMESRYETIRLRVRRSEIFMDSYHQLRNRTGEEMRAKIQVQFQGEEGIDAGGVGKEWYGALAKEIFNPNYALFVQAGGKACTYHPNPMSYVTRDHLDFFHFIGRVIGKAIHDAQNLEAWFTRGFYKHMLGKKVIAADLEAFDPEYFSNLKWMLEHDITDIIELYFCAESDDFGQIKVVDLKPNGRSIPVTNENKYEYIQLMSEHKMTNSVRQQIDAFLKGLHEIVPPELLSLFDDKELELLISGLPDIDIEDLKANTEYHNYTAQSDQIQWFWKVLSEFSQEQRAWFLQFATGTSRVPVEGFKGLVGMRGPQKFCIHRAYGPDRLPSAHTCFNQLDLPDYPSEEVLREKLLQAVHEGHEGFGFA